MPKWISVEDRNPEIYDFCGDESPEYVVIKFKNSYPSYAVGFWTLDGWYINCTCKIVRDEVTHWLEEGE